MVTIPEPTWTPPSNAAYHATEGWWSSSRLKLFRDNPGRAWAAYVAGTMPPGEPSPAMRIGAAVSELLTDPADYGAGVVRVDVQGRNAKAYKDAAAAYPGRLVLTAPEYDTALAVVSAVRTPVTPMAEAARALLVEAPGHYEWSHRWEQSTPEGVVPCMVKIDRATVLRDVVAQIEFKTTRDAHPRAFARQAYDLGYHRQAAFYRLGLADAIARATAGAEGADTYGAPDTGAIAVYFVWVCNEYPHPVGVGPMGDEFLALGEAEVLDDLERLAWCLQDPDDPARWRDGWELSTGTLPVLEPPPWAYARG